MLHIERSKSHCIKFGCYSLPGEAICKKTKKPSTTTKSYWWLYRYAYKYNIRKAIKSVWNVTNKTDEPLYSGNAEQHGVVFDVLWIRFSSCYACALSFSLFFSVFADELLTSVWQQKLCIYLQMLAIGGDILLNMGEIVANLWCLQLFHMFNFCFLIERRYRSLQICMQKETITRVF